MPRVARTAFSPTVLLTLACAAVALASTSATQALSAARAMSALSVDERLHLPDATLVDISGRKVSLGTLRAEHLQRVSRLAHPATLKIANFSGGALAGLVLKASGPTPASTPTSTVLRLPASYRAQFASDYQAACGPANGQMPCLYLPTNTSFQVDRQGLVALDVDPYVFDAGVCGAGGGTVQASTGCIYRYPLVQTVNFTPPLLSSQGIGSVGRRGSGSLFWYETDQHGVLIQQFSNLQPPGSWFSTAASTFCLCSYIYALIPMSSAQSVQVK